MSYKETVRTWFTDTPLQPGVYEDTLSSVPDMPIQPGVYDYNPLESRETASRENSRADTRNLSRDNSGAAVPQELTADPPSDTFAALEDELADVVRKAAVHDAEAIQRLEKVWKGAKRAMKHAEPLDGNIYKYFALRAFMEKRETEDEETLFTPPDSAFDRAIIILGLLFIMVIQVIAPLALVASNIVYILAQSFNPLSTPFGDDPKINKCWAYSGSQWLTVILSQSFLFCFILNAYKGCCTDKEQMEDIFHLALLLEDSGQPVCKSVLFLDAVINSYAAVFLSISMFAVLFKEPDAQMVMLDSLGLAFILNLDDVASDLGFLGDVWNSRRVGRFYAGLKKCKGRPLEEFLEDDEDSDVDPVDKIDFEHASKQMNRIPRCVYGTAQCCLILLLPWALATPFFLMHSAEDDPALKLLLKGEFLEHILSIWKFGTN